MTAMGISDVGIDERSTAVTVDFPAEPGGSYQVTISYPGDDAEQPASMVLDWARAHRYAMAVLTAATYATHDAAVLAQLEHHFGLPRMQALSVLARFREGRPELDQAGLGVLQLEPAVSQVGTPFLRCSLVDGRRTWTWETGRATNHAMVLLLSGPSARLSVNYQQFLVESIGFKDDQAWGAVRDLIRWRHWTSGTLGRHHRASS